jgi:hypothetical protein
MDVSSYDPCLLLSQDEKPFGVVGLQTDDTLILSSKGFSENEETELKKAGFLVKPIEQLASSTLLVFNSCILNQEDDSVRLIQKGQGGKLVEVDL